MTHCRLATEMCRARCAEGRATMTTDASRTIMSWATAMTASDQYRLGSGVWVSALVVGAVSVVVMGHLPSGGRGRLVVVAVWWSWPSGGLAVWWSWAKH